MKMNLNQLTTALKIVESGHTPTPKRGIENLSKGKSGKRKNLIQQDGHAHSSSVEVNNVQEIAQDDTVLGPAIDLGINADDEQEFNTDDDYVSDDGSFAGDQNIASVMDHDGSEDENEFRDEQSAKVQSLQDDIPDSKVDFPLNRPSQKNASANSIEHFIQSEIDRRWEMKEKELECRLSAGNSGNYDQNQAHNGKTQSKGNSRVKSPSDTTLYAPGLMETPVRGYQGINDYNRHMLNLGCDIAGKEGQSGSSNSRAWHHSRSEKDHTDDISKARSTADKIIIEAEKFKASLTPPKGNTDLNQEFSNGNLVNDTLGKTINELSDQVNKLHTQYPGVSNPGRQVMDEFFHITCHVDPFLKAKIE